MSEIVIAQPTTHPLLPLPSLPIEVRVATHADLAFIDALQKKQSKAVGFMPTAQLEGKIARSEILIASGAGEERLGYLIGADRYFKHDDVGIIYAINVVPGAQRGLIGATLLQAQFERSAYGCRLYCCWCAQDLAANKFWEAMGFVPLAFRTGSPTRGSKGTPRTHIFWQKRIRAGDVRTPWWFPSQTTGGSIRADRLVLPIPHGMHWSEAKPVVLPGMKDRDEGGGKREEKKKALPSSKSSSCLRAPSSSPRQSRVIGGGLRFAAPTPVSTPASTLMEPAKEKKTRGTARGTGRVPAQKNDPRLIAAARELRDRWLEELNAVGAVRALGKYDITAARAARGLMMGDAPSLPLATAKLLPAA